MKIHLKSGKVLETEGDVPMVFGGLVRFNKNLGGNLGGALIEPVKNDPIIPLENIEYMEK